MASECGSYCEAWKLICRNKWSAVISTMVHGPIGLHLLSHYIFMLERRVDLQSTLFQSCGVFVLIVCRYIRSASAICLRSLQCTECSAKHVQTNGLCARTTIFKLWPFTPFSTFPLPPQCLHTPSQFLALPSSSLPRLPPIFRFRLTKVCITVARYCLMY